MKLVDDWRTVIREAGSFWFQVAGIVALVAPELRYRLTGAETDPYALWWLGLFLLLAGLASRVIRQRGTALQKHLKMWAVALLLILLSWMAATEVGAAPASERDTLQIAVPLIAHHEGERLVAYLPTPEDVPTICFGHTAGVRLGQTATHDDCLRWLWAEVAQYRLQLHGSFTAETIALRLPPPRDAAFTSLAYNIGVPACGRSTAVRRLNASQIAAACDAITWWNRQGERVLRGLVVRRSAERALCLQEAPT